MNWQKWFGIGSIFGATAVAMGAFAAHSLKTKLSVYALGVFETGVKYQMYGAFALIGISFLAARIDNPLIQISGWFMVAGILLFSTPLYILATYSISWLGAIAPIGGSCMILAWLILAWTCLKVL